VVRAFRVQRSGVGCPNLHRELFPLDRAEVLDPLSELLRKDRHLLRVRRGVSAVLFMLIVLSRSLKLSPSRLYSLL